MLADDFNALDARFRSAWNSAYRVVYANQAPVEAEPTETWARFTILAGASRREVLGTGAWTTQTGYVVIELFFPKGSSDGDAVALADVAAAIFNNWRSTDKKTRCDVASYATSDEQEWFRYSVTTPWESFR